MSGKDFQQMSVHAIYGDVENVTTYRVFDSKSVKSTSELLHFNFSYVFSAHHVPYIPNKEERSGYAWVT